MNAPDINEAIVLNPELKKVSVEKDQKIPNAATFVFQKEDHTLGNLLRTQLLRDRRVLFAGYRVPHPLEHFVELKVQTTPEITPAQAVSSALECLMTEVSSLQDKFSSEIARVDAQDAAKSGQMTM